MKTKNADARLCGDARRHQKLQTILWALVILLFKSNRIFIKSQILLCFSVAFFVIPNCSFTKCKYFYQIGPDSDYLIRLMKDLQDAYNKKIDDRWNILCPKVGSICVANFSEDKQWSRAEIVGESVFNNNNHWYLLSGFCKDLVFRQIQIIHGPFHHTLESVKLHANTTTNSTHTGPVYTTRWREAIYGKGSYSRTQAPPQSWLGFEPTF